MKERNQINDLPNQLSSFIWRYLKNRKLFLLGFFVVALIWAGEMSLSPYLLKVIIDNVVKYSHDQAKMINSVLVPAALYVSMTLFLNIIFRLYDYIVLILYPEIKSTVTKDLFTYLMNHSYTFFQNNFSGTLTKKIFDMEEIQQIIDIINVWFYPRLFGIIISSATLCLVVNPLFGAILFIWAASFVFLSYLAAKNSESLARQLSEAGSKMGGTLADSISNIMSTKLFSNVQSEISHLSKDLDHLVASDRLLQWKNLKVNFVQGLGVTALIASMLTALIYGSTRGWVSAGDFALVLMLSISFVYSVFDMGKEMLKFSRVLAKCNQALSFIRVPHEITDAPDAKPLIVLKGEITFDQVSFQYDNSTPLFEKLNIRIKPGEKIGLVGYSGGGKSTFIKLILRLLDVQSGRICIDGQEVKKVTKYSLRKQVGTIPQEPELFHRSIMENIRFARIEASDEEVIEAAKKARCHEFISQLPEQYHSLVGERGIKLSGGQKQRIAIARAFLKQAPILLLDEATSSLDSITERYIQDSLHSVMMNKTTIVIAHRLSTLKDMDRILVFVNGKVVEDGSLKDLLNDSNSHFYKLWQMQAEGFIPSAPVYGLPIEPS